MTDLGAHLAQIRVADTHEHTLHEAQWLTGEPNDVLSDLFCHYSQRDLIAQGVSEAAIARLLDSNEEDIEARWLGVEKAWQGMQFTGYGEGVRLTAQHVYGIDELTPKALRAAARRFAELKRPGGRYRLLHDVAKIDHVQVNPFVFPDAADPSAPEFFLYDLSFATPCWGYFDKNHFPGQITDLASLRRAIETYFARHAPRAISVKNQMAYERTLSWQPRSDADAERALAAILKVKDPRTCGEETQRCIGDWCLSLGIELAMQYELPMKIHTGYYYNNNVMPLDRVHAGGLCPLFKAYPKQRFILMHAAYPYEHELSALAKHYTNVSLDLCWAWAIDPLSTCQFVRRYLHSAPISKMMAFGGDSHTPSATYGFLLQMRRWLEKALQAEIDDGFLSERQAMRICDQVLHDNAYNHYDIPAKQAAMRAYTRAPVGVDASVGA